MKSNGAGPQMGLSLVSALSENVLWLILWRRDMSLKTRRITARVRWMLLGTRHSPGRLQQFQ